MFGSHFAWNAAMPDKFSCGFLSYSRENTRIESLNRKRPLLPEVFPSATHNNSLNKLQSTLNRNWW
jgi:hypothetical protein